MEKKELQELANKRYFSKNKTIDAMLATEDGQFFYADHESHAIAHHKKIKTGKIHVLERPAKMKVVKADESGKGAKEPKNPGSGADEGFSPKFNAKETMAKIKAAKSTEELAKVYIELELDRDKRATVVDAYNKKSEEFGGSGPGGQDPISKEELIKAIEAAKTDKEIDDLAAEHDLAKHTDPDVVKAYDAKLDALLED